MKIVSGNVLESDSEVIAHSVNCKGVWGKGLALQAKEKYPSVYERYRIICKSESQYSNLLGTSFVYKPTEAPESPFIACMFTQIDYSEDTRQTNYEAFYKSLESVRTFMCRNSLTSISFPCKIGCGLGGGEWTIIEPMIDYVFKDFNVSVFQLKK